MAFPFAALMLASSGVSAAGSLMGGMAQKNAAELNAFNIKTEKELGKAQALQQHNDRLEVYRSNLSSNIASFAAQGRDVAADRSVGAFLDRQQEIATDDTARSDFMAMMEGYKLDSQAAAVRAEGRAALTSGVMGAFTTLAGGLNQYMQVKMPSPSPTRITVGGSALAPRTSSGAPPVRFGSTPRRSLLNSFNDFLEPRG